MISHSSDNPPDSVVPPTGRTEIVAAAIRLFAESGYHRASVNAIARRAGTSKATVFHHFGSKEALYFEVMREACTSFQSATAIADDSGSAPDVRLHNLLRRDWQLFRMYPESTKLVAREALEGGSERARGLAQGVLREHFSELVALFGDALRPGPSGEELPAELLAIIVIACNAVTFQAQDQLRELPGVGFIDDSDRYASLLTFALLGEAATDADGTGKQNGHGE